MIHEAEVLERIETAIRDELAKERHSSGTYDDIHNEAWGQAIRWVYSMIPDIYRRGSP